MYCRKCGKEINEEAKFCPCCGLSVAGPDTAPASSTEQENVVKQPVSRSKRYVPVVVSAAVVIVAAAVGGILFLNSRPEKSDSWKEEASLTEDAETVETTEETAETTESTTEEAQDTEQAEAVDTALQEINGVALLSTDTVEGQLQQEIIAMNSASYQEAVIDVYADNYTPGVRDFSATWDNTVFYCMEGYQTVAGYLDKNSCILIKKEMRNAKTGNIMQYDIYVNPSNGVLNKIVSIEYLEDGLEITEYYYDNNGKANFIYQYKTDNYVSTYATPDKAGERYLFRDDCMVTWRAISEQGALNFVVGTAEAERMKNQFPQNTMRYYSDFTDEQITGFNNQERKMLNAAYNTYNKVLSSDGIAHIQGFVYNGNGSGLEGASVDLYASDFSTQIYSVKTDTSGMYMIYLPNQEYEYNVCVRKDGMYSAEIYQITMSNEQIGVYQDGVYLFDETDESADVQLTLGDAFQYAADGNGMARLSNAEVFFRQGINNRTGEILWQGSADSGGYLLVTLIPGIYTVEINEADHETMFYTVVANPQIDVCVYEFYATAKLDEGEYAIVLTWGEYPWDLDSHLFTTFGTKTEHIWYGSQYDDFDNFLDVDDTSSYGPETVTIRQFSPSSYYKYCVVDFTNCLTGNYSSRQMSNSMACVNVYSSEGLIATYYVPVEKEGVIWEVFEIRNGHITPIQRYYSNVEDKTWWHSDK